MRAAALPEGAGQVRGDRFDQALVRVGGHQAHSRQAAGDEVTGDVCQAHTGGAPKPSAASVCVNGGCHEGRQFLRGQTPRRVCDVTVESDPL